MKKSKNSEDNPVNKAENLQTNNLAQDQQTPEAAKGPAGDAEAEGQAEGGQSASSGQPDSCQTLRDSLAAKEKDFCVLSDKYLRLMAEYDNFRRRSQKEKDALYGESIALVIKEWLPVLDSIDLADLAAGQYTNEDARMIAAGLAKIQKQVDEVLERLGVQEIASCGQPFDPNMHEAVMHVQDDAVGASTVVDVFQKGYRRDDRIIRHSVVKVAN